MKTTNETEYKKGDTVFFKVIANAGSYATPKNRVYGTGKLSWIYKHHGGKEFEGVINRVYKNSYSITYGGLDRDNIEAYMNFNTLKENVRSKLDF